MILREFAAIRLHAARKTITPPMFFILVELWLAQAKSLPAAGRPVPLVAPFGTPFEAQGKQGKRDRHAS